MKLSPDKVIRYARAYWWVGALVASAATFFLVLWLSVGQAVWFDEGYSIIIAKRPVGELIALTALDAHPPLYYLLLKGWAGIFGWGEVALRAFSALSAALSVGVMITVLRKLFSVRIALVAAPFLVMAPFFLRYGYEIRMYALVALIGVVATLVLATARTTKQTRYWVLYGLLVAIGMYTLYMSILIWLAHFVWLVSLARSAKQPIFRQKWWLGYGIAIAAFLPWVPALIGQLKNSALPNITSQVTLESLSSVAGFMTSYTPSWEIGAWLSLGILAILSLLIYLYGKVWQRLSGKARQGIVLISLCFLVPLAFLAVISLPPLRPYFMERYIVHIVLFGYALVGIIMAYSWKYGYRKLAGGLGAIMLIMTGVGIANLSNTGNFNYQQLSKPNASAIRQAVGNCQQTTVLADNPYLYIDTAYYFDDCHLTFASKNPQAKLRGGYAPLASSPDYVASSMAITTPRLVYLSREGKGSIIIDDRYRLENEVKKDNILIQTFGLKAGS